MNPTTCTGCLSGNPEECAALPGCNAQNLEVVEGWREELAADLARFYDAEHVKSERFHAGLTDWRDSSGVVHRLECEDGAFALVWSRSDNDGPRVYVRTPDQLSELRASLIPSR